MPLQIRLFSGTTGLNNRIDPVRLSFDRETGIAELSETANIRIDPTGRPSRQKGYTKLASGNFSNLCKFDCGGYTLAIKDGTTLVAVDEDGNYTNVRTGLTSGAYMDYEKASDGSKDYIYYLNGNERGRVYDRTNYDWSAGTYYGPDTTKGFSDPPNGHLLTLYNGRMYIADGNAIYASEPHDFTKYNLAEGYILFPGKITFLDNVDGGIFVSDASSIYFLAGDDILHSDRQFALKKLYDRPIIRGTGVKTMAENLRLDVIGEVIIAWTDFGCMVLGPNGYCRNHTIEKLIRRTPAEGNNYLPDSNNGASIIINNEELVTTFY